MSKVSKTLKSEDVIYNIRKDTQRPMRSIHNKREEHSIDEQPESKPCLTRNHKIFLFISAVIIVAVIIILVVFLTGGEPDPPCSPNTNPQEPTKIETEFKFNNKLREPYYIFVNQNYTEEIMTQGTKTNQFYDRKTGYNIYILNETEATEETKNLYDKIYTAAILISNQCIDTKSNNCEPKSMLDLTTATRRNLRYLEEDIPDLKDIPIPLCLFNITDNDVILSMSCPESLQKSIRQAMILDLYFFRPPAIKRPAKEANNVNITKIPKDGKEIINEINKGICDVLDAFESFCTTEMNTTTDSNGNVISYDEIAFTNITHDENNFYIKNKITYLKDQSEKLTNIDKEAYKEALERLIEKLKPHFKHYEEFSMDDFKKLYKVSKNITIEEDNTTKSRRTLYQNEAETAVNGEELFKYRHYTDANLNLNLNNILTDYSDAMIASINLMINEDQREIASSRETSNFNTIIKNLRDLSNSGNEEARILLNNIYHNLDNVDDVIFDNITKLIQSIVDDDMKSLSYIFDSTLNMEDLSIFPLKLVEVSTKLKNNLNNIYTNYINGGGMKSKLNLLNEDIYSFLSQSHRKLDNVFQNIRSLSNSLKSSKSRLTEIATYYLNNTSDSFVDLVENALELLLNYYKNEGNKIINEINELVDNFVSKFNKSIESERIKINNLLELLENNYMNITIENGNEEDKNLLLSNLRDSNDIINSIIIKVEELIRNQMNLKANGYFVTNNEIKELNNSYMPDVEEALIASQNSDNNQLIDKLFDETYRQMKDNYTSLMISQENKIQENMVFYTDPLEKGLFSEKNKTYIESNISTIGSKITDTINDENDEYLKLANKEINSFIEKNDKILKESINNLIAMFSDDSFISLANLFQTAFDSSFNTINKNIETNKVLINNYFSGLTGIFTSDEKIKELLKTFEIDEMHLPTYLYYWSSTHYVYFTSFYDIIQKKSKTAGYINKYKKFLEQLDISKDYIEQQMPLELKYEYKNTITKLKELLQIMKNVQLSERFTNYPELKFLDDNVKNLDNLYKTINKYFSDEIYNDNFLPKINNYKSNSINKLNKIETDIIVPNHNIINQFQTVNDYTNDFCFAFKRKKTYTCTNGVIYYPESTSNYCEILKGSENNYKNLVSFSIYSDANLKNYIATFDRFYSKIKNIVTSYTETISELSKKLYEFEQQSISVTSTGVYLNEIKNLINNSILENYFGNNIILETYDFFKKDAEQRISKVLDEVSEDWGNYFSNANLEINKNLNDYKSSVSELGALSIIYYNYLYQEIMEEYYYLMLDHEKREFNSTISYYYSYLIRQINSERQLIIYNLPTNNIGFERVIEQRKKEINEAFDELIKKILEKKNGDLSEYNQLYLLQVPNTNFFEISSVITEAKKKLKKNCEALAVKLYSLQNSLTNDLYSYISRLYLDNSVSGKQINQFFTEIENSNFIYLELDKFRELIIKNWIFDQNSFIKLLNDTFNENDAQIQAELATKKDNYKTMLKNELIKYKLFIKNEMTLRITELYTNAIHKLNDNDIAKIKSDVTDIVNKIIFYLKKEEERLKETTMSYYKDYSLFNQTIENYKKKIFQNLDNKINNFVNEQKNYIEQTVYENYYKKYLNVYLTNIRQETELCDDYNLLNSTYNIGDIIDSIATNDIAEEFENNVKYYIMYKYEDTYESLFYQLNLNEIKSYINNQIDEEYTAFISVLKNKANIDEKEVGYFKYDLSDETKEEIDNFIQEKNKAYISIIDSLKGQTYKNIDVKNIIDWEIPDFSRISNTINSIKNLFTTFISAQKANENNKIKNCIKEVIDFNFNDLLNNLIPSFGNEFFEKIIAYNENFKIKYLYNNLEWALKELISYIEIVDSLNKINQITKDLKIKIYKMNELDTKILQKNKKILDLLSTKVDDFIFDSSNYIIQQYRIYIVNDANIELSFSPETIKTIKSVFDSCTSKLNEDYKNMIEKYLGEKIIAVYKNILDEKTESILRRINSEREYLKKQLDDILSIDPDDVLNEINTKLNSTTEALNDYNTNFEQYNLPSEIKDYLYSFGEKEIHPFSEEFGLLIDNLYKDIIILNLDKNADDYEKAYDYEAFDQTKDDSYNKIKDEYIEHINKYTHLYYDNYEENLENKMSEIARRRLSEEFVRKMPDKSLDETFNKLLNTSKNLKIFVESLEKFDEFDKKISDSVNNLNSAFKESEKLINENNYTSEVKENLTLKLYYLKNHSSEYYSKINESFYDYKNYIKDSISEIDTFLNQCANITLTTFIKKYKEILDKVKPLNLMKKDKIDLFEDEKDVKIQNYQITINTKIENILQEAEFNYNYHYDQNYISGIKFPNINTNLINLMRPKKATFNIIKDITDCAQEIETIEINFNNVNYSVSLEFNPDSQDVISKIIGLFDDYEYTVERYNTSDTTEVICTGNNYHTIQICYPGICTNAKDHVLVPLHKETVKKRSFNKTVNIPE